MTSSLSAHAAPFVPFSQRTKTAVTVTTPKQFPPLDDIPLLTDKAAHSVTNFDLRMDYPLITPPLITPQIHNTPAGSSVVAAPTQVINIYYGTTRTPLYVPVVSPFRDIHVTAATMDFPDLKAMAKDPRYSPWMNDDGFISHVYKTVEQRAREKSRLALAAQTGAKVAQQSAATRTSEIGSRAKSAGKSTVIGDRTLTSVKSSTRANPPGGCAVSPPPRSVAAPESSWSDFLINPLSFDSAPYLPLFSAPPSHTSLPSCLPVPSFVEPAQRLTEADGTKFVHGPHPYSQPDEPINSLADLVVRDSSWGRRSLYSNPLWSDYESSVPDTGFDPMVSDPRLGLRNEPHPDHYARSLIAERPFFRPAVTHTEGRPLYAHHPIRHYFANPLDLTTIASILTGQTAYGEITHLTRFVTQLAQPDCLRHLIAGALVRQECGEAHPNGFLRLPLLREGAGAERVYELRLHVWDHTTFAEDVHDHRVAFATACIAGGYDNALYRTARAEEKGLSLYALTAVKKYSPHNHFALRADERPPVVVDEIYPFRQGTQYALLPDLLHKVTNLLPGTITLTLRGVDRGRASTLVWAKDPLLVDTPVRNCTPLSLSDSIDAYATVLKCLADQACLH